MIKLIIELDTMINLNNLQQNNYWYEPKLWLFFVFQQQKLQLDQELFSIFFKKKQKQIQTIFLKVI